MTGEETVREFVRAFNERDLDAFEATLDPEVQLHSMKGIREGIPAARAWATREPVSYTHLTLPTSELV